MEGKGILFKRFADIDVFDIEINETTVEGMVDVVKSLEPTFGGINLEDIKAPECFEIEARLKERMKIPVFHDDQHGTAIIVGAAILNWLDLTGRDITKTKLVASGAGAASIACLRLLIVAGFSKDNIIVTDRDGVIYKGRNKGMDPYKEDFAAETSCRTLDDAIPKSHIFLGLSGPGVLTKEHVAKMSKAPLIMALANPTPLLPDGSISSVFASAAVLMDANQLPRNLPPAYPLLTKPIERQRPEFSHCDGSPTGVRLIILANRVKAVPLKILVAAFSVLFLNFLMSCSKLIFLIAPHKSQLFPVLWWRSHQ